jgi:hypothetical protein
MSRKHTDLSPNCTLTRGTDHALGNFIQLSDLRYALSDEDEQGEGYILEWDAVFGFTKNLINATEADLGDDKRLLELANEFFKESE